MVPSNQSLQILRPGTADFSFIAPAENRVLGAKLDWVHVGKAVDLERPLQTAGRVADAIVGVAKFIESSCSNWDAIESVDDRVERSPGPGPGSGYTESKPSVWCGRRPYQMAFVYLKGSYILFGGCSADW